jgi:hypothetical protein
MAQQISGKSKRQDAKLAAFFQRPSLNRIYYDQFSVVKPRNLLEVSGYAVKALFIKFGSNPNNGREQANVEPDPPLNPPNTPSRGVDYWVCRGQVASHS